MRAYGPGSGWVCRKGALGGGGRQGCSLGFHVGLHPDLVGISGNKGQGLGPGVWNWESDFRLSSQGSSTEVTEAALTSSELTPAPTRASALHSWGR